VGKVRADARPHLARGGFARTSAATAARCWRSSTAFLPATVNARIDEAHRGPCPECGAPAPIDFYKSYKAYSVIIATTWKTETHVCCRRCARRHQWKAIGFTAGLGWWGVPWGFVATPIQIGRNLIEMCQRWTGPSVEFVRAVRLNFARSIAAANERPRSFKKFEET
jgi:hypothetical protein